MPVSVIKQLDNAAQPARLLADGSFYATVTKPCQTATIKISTVLHLESIISKQWGIKMSRILLAALLLMTLSDRCLAWDSICNVAGNYVHSTTAAVGELSDKLMNRSFEGSGKVTDVRNGGLSSKYAVIVNCGNDVIVEIPTNSPRASQNLKIGDSVNFSGLLTGIYRKRYANTHREFIKVNLNDASSVW